MSTRPTRRATRRTAIVESSDEDMPDAPQDVEDSGDDFTPAPAATPRRAAGRKRTAAETPTPAPPAKSSAPAPSIVEPSEVLDPDQTDVPPKRPAPAATPARRTSRSPKMSVSPANLHNRRQEDETMLAAAKPIKAMDTSRTMAIPTVEETGPKARVVITKLVLTNFKSYAGEQEVGPFHASFSSVVGPNGSGKSNVIDSKMRQGKISALIHNSAQYPNLSHCEVAVHFHEVMDLPEGGCEAFKNNSSQLGGEAANEHEDGLLEYLEDIIGTSKYKTPIEEAATEVETLNEVCVEKSGRVQHKEKALAYIRDENELVTKQSALYQLYVAECDDNIAAELDAELEKHHGSEQIIKQLEKGYSRGSREYDAQDKETQALIKEMTKFDQERRKKLEKTIANAEGSTFEAEQTIEQCANDIETWAEEIVSLEQRVKEEEAELAHLSDQIAAKQKELEPSKDMINQKQSAIAKANAGAVALEEMQAKIAAIEESQQAKAEELKQRAVAELEKLTQEEPKLRAQLSNARQKADEARSNLSATQTQGNSGRIDGFHGRLGNLACGALDNFVTDTTNLGRGNFICLDKLRSRDLSPIQTPENAPPFYHALQDTLVATDLAQANRIAYGARRWRVSGTMSGGGSTVKKGLMSSKLASGTSREQLEQAFQEIRSLKEQIPELDTKMQKINLERRTDDSRIRLHSGTAGIMEIGGEKLRAQRATEVSNAELKKDHAKASKELEAATRDSEKLEAEIQNQGDKAEDYKTRKQELAEMKAELDGKTAELNETRALEIEMRNKLEESQKEKRSKLTLQNIADLESGSSSAAPARPQTPPNPPSHDGDEDVEMEDVEMEDASAQLQAEAEAEDETMTQSAHKQGRAAPLELPQYSKDELADMNKKTLLGEIAALEEKTQNVNVDLGVLAEYRRRVEEHAARSSDLASAVAQRDAAKKRCDDLRRLRLEGFMEGFSTISLRLKEMYQMITMGGNAELELVDSLDPFSEGILFSVMPPKKSWKNIGNLSGGEKTLSSLALVFALHHYKPTPLYVMDEIDAALDFRNVSIVANYIKERTKNAQFIVISLRNNMFELAARLVGVYKVNHMTKSVTIENRDYVLGRNQPGHGGQGQGQGQGQQARGQQQQQRPQQGQQHLQAQQQQVLVVIMVTMVKLVTSLLGAAVATATVLPVQELGGLAAMNSTTTALEGGFIQQCEVYNVGKFGEIISRLVAQCGDDQPLSQLHNTWLDLNLCLANNNGMLAWRDHGNAIGSCNCHARHFDTQYIECSCKDGAGEWKDSSLDLNEGVRYDMGHHVLACYGNLGVFDE
ncbi:hypothetical protein B0I37DRAFT_391299 [Chaetomium sp. MPI-CAGE-AT-0009]|nr:hypothetical protein B0I37DRAFT_391299 [Chaetomium sp. MPI-CAGE-AT-0009]